MPTETPEKFSVGSLQNPIVGATVDSTIQGDRVVATALIHPISGTGEITMMTPPWVGFAGEVILLPADASTVTTGGATNGFAKAVTHVANQAIGYVYNPVTDLWWPRGKPAA